MFRTRYAHKCCMTRITVSLLISTPWTVASGTQFASISVSCHVKHCFTKTVLFPMNMEPMGEVVRLPLKPLVVPQVPLQMLLHRLTMPSR